MDHGRIIEMAAIIGTVFASTGFWNFLQSRVNRKSATTRLHLGLAHDRIIFLCRKWLEQGWVTVDEYEDFLTYLWEPYSEIGGNGMAEKMFAEIQKLPLLGAKPVDLTLKETTS